MTETQIKDRMAALNQQIRYLSDEAIHKIQSQNYDGAMMTLALIRYYQGETHGLYLSIRKPDSD